MGEIRFNNHTPVYYGFNYNYESQTQSIIDYLLKDKNDFFEPYCCLVDKSGLFSEITCHHALRLVNAQKERLMNVGWFQFFTLPTFFEFASRIQQFVHEIRIEVDDIPEQAMSNRILLPRRDKGQSHRYIFDRHFQIGITHLSQRLCVLIIDVSAINQIAWQLLYEHFSLLRLIVFGNYRADFRVIVISQPSAHRSPQSIKPLIVEFEPPKDPSAPSLISNFSQLHPIQPPKSQMRGGELANPTYKIEELMWPLITLNSGAEREAINYLRNKIGKDLNDPFWPLIRKGVVKQLREGGLAVSSEILAKSTLSLNSFSENQTTANVIRIIGFQPLEQLLPRKKGLHAIDRLEASQDFLVEALAETIGFYVSNDANGANAILDMLINSDIALHISEINAVRSKIVINYLSQMILSEDEIENPLFFKTLEHVIAGYCNHITSTCHAGPEQAHEAARMQYNLYFIMDHVSSRRPMLFSSAKPENILLERRVSTAKQAAKYQGGKIPHDSRLEMKHRLHQGWYEFDSGRPSKASEIFLNIAEQSWVIASQDERLIMDSNSVFRIWHYDALVLAIAIEPRLLENQEVAFKANKFLQRYGGFKNVSSLRLFLQKKEVGLQPIYLEIETPRSMSKAKVYYTIYDLFSALFVADSLFFSMGIIPELVFVTDREEIKRHLKDKRWLHVFIGSPDSPGEMGQIIGSLDPDLIQTYQSCLFSDFAMPFRAIIYGQIVVVTLASGLGAIPDSWTKAMASQYQFPELAQRMEDSLMELTILTSTLSHVLKKLGERATNSLIDKISEAISKRSSSDDGESKQPMKSQALRQYSAQLKSGTGDEALSTLRDNLSKPQFRAFIEIANIHGFTELLDMELQQLTQKIPDVQPSDYMDILEIMVHICDFLRKGDGLRYNDIKRLNIFQTQINLQRNNLSLINDKMAAAASAEEQLYSVDVKIRTLFSGFLELCNTIGRYVK